MAICGREDEELQSARTALSRKHPGQVTALACDVSKLEDVKAFVETVAAKSGVNILVNNAGIGITTPFDELSPDEWYTTININLTGVFHLCHCVVPIMKKMGGGDIVNISSRSARNPHIGGAAYCASKFGLNGLSEVLQLDLRKHRIRVSSIMPGRVSTNFAGEAPQDWHVAPEDVAQAVVDALKLPSRNFMGRLDLRPSFPPG